MASSPTPRDELDEKLFEIIQDIYSIGFANGQESREPLHEDRKIEAIRQFFKDAGWLSPEEARKIYDAITSASIDIIRNDPSIYEISDEDMKTIMDLRKAAGIQD